MQPCSVEDDVVWKRKLANGKAVREEKRRKWKQKRNRRSEQENRDEERLAWFKKNAHFATLVKETDVRSLRGDSSATQNEQQSSFLVEYVSPYLNLKDSSRRTVESSHTERLFVAEGTETVRMLIDQCVPSGNCELSSPIQLKSIFLKPSVFFDSPVSIISDVQKLIDRCNVKKEPPFHVLVGDDAVLSEIAGFHIARGALACGVVPRRDEEWLESFLARFQRKEKSDPCCSLRVLGLDALSDTANVGSIIRCASAFGIDVIVMSNDSCSVWYRRAVRVSMGHVCRVPCVRVIDLAATIRQLHDKFGIVSYAAVADHEADIMLEDISRGNIPRSWCCVVGNEAHGISKKVQNACGTKVRIAMVDGVDSLSVPVATGIILHGLKERERNEQEVRVADEILARNTCN